jgi:site-specific recombinase XerD
MTMITLAGLESDIAEFLLLKRSLGHRYQTAEYLLKAFRRFAQARATSPRRRGRGKWISLEASIKAWLSRPSMRKPTTSAIELGVLRHLCMYRRRRDGRGFVPEQAWAPRTKSQFHAHVFSHEQMRQLLKAASTLQELSIAPETLHTLRLDLYCTGLRPGEAVRLRLGDVDLAKRMFFISESKGKSRWVPFGSDLARKLRSYLRYRASIAKVAKQTATDAWFIQRDGRPLTLARASGAVRELLRSEGLKPKTGRVGPRPYDMRHTYTVHRLTDWSRKGVDVHARLPWLSAYLGHDNALGTEHYMHATPELLRLANKRFEKRFHQNRKRQ